MRVEGRSVICTPTHTAKLALRETAEDEDEEEEWEGEVITGSKVENANADEQMTQDRSKNKSYSEEKMTGGLFMMGEAGDNGGEVMRVFIPGMKSRIPHGHLNNARLLLCAAVGVQPMVNYSNTVSIV